MDNVATSECTGNEPAAGPACQDVSSLRWWTAFPSRMHTGVPLATLVFNVAAVHFKSSTGCSDRVNFIKVTNSDVGTLTKASALRHPDQKD